jgi:hypothetical protein
MNKDRDLQNGIGVQMGQIQVIEIKETAEKGRNRKSKTVEEEWNINNRFMGVFYWNSDPTTDPPGIEFFRRKNPDGHKMEKVRLRNNRHMVTCERQLTVGVDGGNDSSGRTRSFLLRRHLNLTGEQSGSRIANRQRGSGSRKARTRARNVETRNSAVHIGFSRARCCFQKVPSHHPAVISKTAGVPHHHPTVISKTAGVPRHHLAAISKKAGVPCHYSAIVSKTTDTAQIDSTAVSKNADNT